MTSVAVAVNGGSGGGGGDGSRRAVKWAVENLMPRADRFVLVHVIPNVISIPTPCKISLFLILFLFLPSSLLYLYIYIYTQNVYKVWILGSHLFGEEEI